MEEKGFHQEFQFRGETYIMQVKHHLELTFEERILYEILEGEFLVHLFDLRGSRSFDVLLDENLMWTTTASELLVDKELVEEIGKHIDSFND